MNKPNAHNTKKITFRYLAENYKIFCQKLPMNNFHTWMKCTADGGFLVFERMNALTLTHEKDGSCQSDTLHDNDGDNGGMPLTVGIGNGARPSTNTATAIVAHVIQS